MSDNTISVTIKGRIKSISNTQVVSDKFQKREFKVEQTTGDYPNSYKLEFIQDKVDILNEYTIGQEVIVTANLNGRDWTNKEGKEMNFLTLQAWRIELQKEYSNQTDFDDIVTHEQPKDDDDLPF